MATIPLAIAIIMITLLGLAGCSNSALPTSTPAPATATSSPLSILEQQAKLIEELAEQQAILEATAEAVAYEIMLKATAEASNMLLPNTLNQFLEIEVGLPFFHLTDSQIDCVIDQFGHDSIQQLLTGSDRATIIQFIKSAEKCVTIKQLLLEYTQLTLGPSVSECVSDKVKDVIFHELLIAEINAERDGVFGTSYDHEMSLGGIFFACAQLIE